MMEEIEKLRRPLSERLLEEVFEHLHQVVGQASMTWTDIEGAGTYCTEEAGKIAFELCHYVADLLDEAREQAGDDEAGYIESSGAPIGTMLLPIPRIVIKTLEGGK